LYGFLNNEGEDIIPRKMRQRGLGACGRSGNIKGISFVDWHDFRLSGGFGE
jgi:hypothetical protein